MSKAKFKKDKFVNPNGPLTKIDNTNLTDEIALHLLESGKAQESDFDTLPEGHKSKNAATKAAPANEKSEEDKQKEAAEKAAAKQAAKDQAEKDVVTFDPEAADAYENGKKILRGLGITPASTKKADVFAALEKAKPKTQTTE